MGLPKIWSWLFFVPLAFSLICLLTFVNKMPESLVFMIGLFSNSELSVVLLVDHLSMVFSVTVGWVSMFVFIYSNYYMEGSTMKKSFIFTLLCFVISMFIMCFSVDLFWVMIGWDGLGLSSFCLINFFQNWKSMNSAMITFISNRVGDFCLITAIFFFLMFEGSLFFMSDSEFYFSQLILILGAMSKSSQVPFSAWLPLAMAAPTPVSSLVHSSTLVTAGVYLLIRFNPVLGESSKDVIFYLSILTILLACVSSVGEYDLKKIVALSTLSHVGLMILFVSMDLCLPSLMHLVSHAFFKSLLFMICGLIIHEESNWQDVRKIGKLKNDSFLSSIFTLSMLSMIGTPFFSGFVSKEILLHSFFYNGISWVKIFSVYFAIGLTCSYSARMLYFSILSPSAMCHSTGGNSIFLEKILFLSSIFSSFLGGSLIYLISSKVNFPEEVYFSTFMKMLLLAAMISGVIFGLVCGLFFSMIPKEFTLVSHNMWFILSMNLVFQQKIFLSSYFSFWKMDPNGVSKSVLYSARQVLNAASGSFSFFWGKNFFFTKMFCIFLCLVLIFSL